MRAPCFSFGGTKVPQGIRSVDQTNEHSVPVVADGTAAVTSTGESVDQHSTAIRVLNAFHSARQGQYSELGVCDFRRRKHQQPSPPLGLPLPATIPQPTRGAHGLLERSPPAASS